MMADTRKENTEGKNTLYCCSLLREGWGRSGLSSFPRFVQSHALLYLFGVRAAVCFTVPESHLFACFEVAMRLLPDQTNAAAFIFINRRLGPGV